MSKACKENSTQEAFLFLPGAGLHDGQWHEVRFIAKENCAVLTIDGDEASSMKSNSPLKIITGEKYLFGGKVFTLPGGGGGGGEGRGE